MSTQATSNSSSSTPLPPPPPPPPTTSTCNFTSTPCPLNSPPRKVISHIFGRNKLATAAIPDNMIPKICRKHYQRARYRVGIFGLMQWRFVQEVLARVADGGEIRYFDIVVRKRAVIEGCGDDDDDEGGGGSRPELENDPRGTIWNSRVPWELEELLRSQRRFSLQATGWIMAGIEAVLLAAKEKGENRFFPDIELLPVVVVEARSGETEVKIGKAPALVQQDESDTESSLFFPDDDDAMLLDDQDTEKEKESGDETDGQTQSDVTHDKGKGKARESIPSSTKRLQIARAPRSATRVGEPGSSGHGRRLRLRGPKAP